MPVVTCLGKTVALTSLHTYMCMYSTLDQNAWKDEKYDEVWNWIKTEEKVILPNGLY